MDQLVVVTRNGQEIERYTVPFEKAYDLERLQGIDAVEDIIKGAKEGIVNLLPEQLEKF